MLRNELRAGLSRFFGAIRAGIGWLVLASALVRPAWAAVIPVGDAHVQAGLSPYNWVVSADSASTAVCGASVKVGFKGTKSVAVAIDTSRIELPSPHRFPILAWTVNGGPEQTHQLAAGETSVALCTDAADPVIDLYVKGMCPWINRFEGDPPPNALTITGFIVDDGATSVAAEQPARIWLSIGDSITSGDGAAYAEKQGRPKNDLWAESDDGRASYAWLLAKHFGFRESRLAYGGYNWTGGLAKMPKLATLIDQITSATSRLKDGALQPPPAIVTVNLGTNGKPKVEDVVESLTAVRKRCGPQPPIIVFVPFIGWSRDEVTAGVKAYQEASGDAGIHLIDLGKFTFATADGVHPTAAGHQAIFDAALPALEPIVREAIKQHSQPGTR